MDSADVRMLTEIGMIGAGAGGTLLREVEQLFRGLMVLRPQRDFPYLGLATAYLNQQRPDDAVLVLEQGLRVMHTGQDHDHADRSMVQVFHGMALLMARRTAEATQVLQALSQTTRHEPALRLARSLLGIKAPATDHPSSKENP